MAPSKDKWVRRFVITETARHKKGFTIYKVTSVIFLKASPEAVSKVSVWKRYNDFRKLHSELSVQHAALHIKDPFPPFPKPKFFGRFEAEVIEERRQCAIKLLEFIAKHTSLFTSNVFVKFFETSHLNDYLTDCSQSISSDTSEDDRSTIPTDTESVNSSTFQSTSPNASRSTLNTPSYIPKFVCTERIRPTLIKGISHDGSKVARNMENEKSPVPVSRLNAGTNGEERAVTNRSETMGSVNSHARIDSIDDVTKNSHKNDNDGSEIQVSDMNFVAFDPIELRKGSELTSDAISGQDYSQTKNELSHSGSFSFVHDGSDLPSAQEDSGQYILVAAAHMSAAFRHEATAEFEEAFTQYKLGIASLLNGVQKDPDFERKNTIKGKISKYLERAERLYNRHLNCNVSVLSKPVSELQNYKVLRVMGSVILVRDTLRECNRIIKSIPKAAGNKENLSDYILRGKVPYMVQLYACVQTETTVFLVLQYASGGKLWEYIKSYYAAHKNKLHACERGHTRSVSCDAIIQSSFNKENETSHKNVFEEEQKSMNSGANEVQDNSNKNIENVEISPEDSLKRLEEEFGANSKYNKDLPTTDLLENAHKLLRSVNATLKKSNSIASRLNGTEQVPLNEQDKTDSKPAINTNHTANNQNASDSPDFDQTSSDASKNIEAAENTESSYDLSELSASCSPTDLSSSKYRSPNPSSSQCSAEKAKDQRKQEKLNIDPANFNSTNEPTEKIRICEDRNYADESPETLRSPVECLENSTGETKLNGISFGEGTNPPLNEFTGNDDAGASLKMCRRDDENSLQPQASEDSGVEMEEELWKLPEGTVRLWAAEVLLSLESLHQQDVVVSDLRPDNILLGDGGHVAVSYIVPRRNAELPQPRKPYSAPELFMFLPTSAPSPAADVWSFGVLLYELFAGIQFQSRHPGPFHSHSLLSIPDELSSNAKALLSSVLKYQPGERLTIPEIKQHPFFASVDWRNLLNP